MNLGDISKDHFSVIMWLWTFFEYVIVGYVIVGFFHCWLR
jgi:hypothetical protein